ncbi:MAG: helix-turn-helix transcriptional regulator [Acidimicrobiales bacterium]
MAASPAAVLEITRRCHAGLDASTLQEELLKRLQRVVAFDAASISTVDPATLLPTSLWAEESPPEVFPPLLANEYLEDDFSKFRDLVRGRRRVDSLHRATHDRPERSPRFRHVFAPTGMGDELRAAFVTAGTCWGLACLLRDDSSPTFTEPEACLIAKLGPHIAEGFRMSMLLEQGSLDRPDPDGPGVLVLTDDLSILASNPVADRWLAEITTERDPVINGLPYAVSGVVAALRGLSSPELASDIQPRVRIRARSGRGLVLHASYLAGDHEGAQAIAVVLEPARRVELAPLFMQAHGLTPKESEVTRLVLLGKSTTEISPELCISEHTVQDHLKSIFDKVGVGSRRELVAQILSEHAGHEAEFPGWRADRRTLMSRAPLRALRGTAC